MLQQNAELFRFYSDYSTNDVKKERRVVYFSSDAEVTDTDISLGTEQELTPSLKSLR